MTTSKVFCGLATQPKVDMCRSVLWRLSGWILSSGASMCSPCLGHQPTSTYVFSSTLLSFHALPFATQAFTTTMDQAMCLMPLAFPMICTGRHSCACTSVLLRDHNHFFCMLISPQCYFKDRQHYLRKSELTCISWVSASAL